MTQKRSYWSSKLSTYIYIIWTCVQFHVCFQTPKLEEDLRLLNIGDTYAQEYALPSLSACCPVASEGSEIYLIEINNSKSTSRLNFIVWVTCVVRRCWIYILLIFNNDFQPYFMLTWLDLVWNSSPFCLHFLRGYVYRRTLKLAIHPWHWHACRKILQRVQ